MRVLRLSLALAFVALGFATWARPASALGSCLIDGVIYPATIKGPG